MRSLITLLITLFIVTNVHAKGKKLAPVSIAFYAESTDLQSKKFSVEIDTPQGKRFMSKVPIIVTSDITHFHTFQSPHNPALLGATFQIDRDGAQRLKVASAQGRGNWILCTVNGVVVDMLRIDKQVDGRVITIWRGLDPEIEKICNQLIPRIGETDKQWKERLKLEKKTLRQ